MFLMSSEAQKFKILRMSNLSFLLLLLMLLVSYQKSHGASLVVQWLRIHLPMQGTRVRALVWEDPTCRGATGPVSHSC